MMASRVPAITFTFPQCFDSVGAMDHSLKSSVLKDMLWQHRPTSLPCWWVSAHTSWCLRGVSILALWRLSSFQWLIPVPQFPHLVQVKLSNGLSTFSKHCPSPSAHLSRGAPGTRTAAASQGQPHTWEPLSETRAPAPPSPPRGNGAQPKKSFIFIYMCDFLGVFVSSCRVIFFSFNISCSAGQRGMNFYRLKISFFFFLHKGYFHWI